jgi:ribosome biogenesis GTPase
VKRRARALAGWTRAGDRIEKTFRFADYYRTMAFVNAWRRSPTARIITRSRGALRPVRRRVVDAQLPAGSRKTTASAPPGSKPSWRDARRAGRVRGPRALEEGLVTASRRRHYAVLLDSGEASSACCKGRDTTLACGDRVRVARDGGRRIDRGVLPRTTLFYRSDEFREKLIAANVTQVVGVVAPDITVDEELVNRWIDRAEAQGCRFVLAANKSDQPGFAPFSPACNHSQRSAMPSFRSRRRSTWRRSGRCCAASAPFSSASPDGQDDDPQRHRAARAGEDGGRSPRRCRPAGTRRRSRRSTRLPESDGGGWIVDSPGLKVFGLAHIDPERIEEAFVEIRPLLGHCRFRDCRHDREPGCAIWQAVGRRQGRGRIASR